MTGDKNNNGQVYMKINGNARIEYDSNGKITYVADIDKGKDSLNETATNYVHELNKDMERATKEANELAKTFDAEFGGAQIVEGAPKTTAKSSQTAASALPSREAAQHAAAVGRYAGSGNKDSK